MKRLLLTTLAWRPELRSGVWRPMAMAKHLPATGWQATVVTTTSRYIPNGPPTERPTETPPLQLVSPAGERTLEFLSCVAHPLLRCIGKDGDWLAKGLAWRLAKKASPEMTFPDIGTGYAKFIRPMSRRLLRLARSGKYDAIFLTAPPYSVVPIAARVAKASPIPVVLDFRDPWSQCFTTQLTDAQLARARRIERHAIESAAAITVVSPRQQDDLRELYPEFAKKIHLVYNGYDPEEIPAANPSKDKFILGLLGCSYDIAHDLLEAIRLAGQREPAFLEKFLLRWLGPNQHIDQEVARLGLQANVELTGPRPHGEAMDLSADCSALWLETPFTEGTDYIIRGKVFEYMALGLPILGTARPSACVRELLSPVRAKLIASRQPADIATLWLEAFADFQAGRLEISHHETYTCQFTRAAQAERLAGVLDDL